MSFSAKEAETKQIMEYGEYAINDKAKLRNKLES